MINELSYCPFCKPEFGREIILGNELCYCVYDKYPVSKGHALIIPKRHCSDYFELTNEEQASCWQMVNKLRTVVSEKYNPDGFNIGINVNKWRYFCAIMAGMLAAMGGALLSLSQLNMFV